MLDEASPNLHGLRGDRHAVVTSVAQTPDVERRERSLAVIRYPTDEEISELAYEMFLQHRTARLTDYWRMAEATLLDRAARQIPKVHGPARMPW